MVSYDSRFFQGVSSPSAAFHVRAAGQSEFLAVAGNEPAGTAESEKDGLLQDTSQ